MSWVDLKSWLEWESPKSFNEDKVKKLAEFYYDIQKIQYPDFILDDLNEVQVFVEMVNYLEDLFFYKGYGYLWIENNEIYSLIAFYYIKERFLKPAFVLHQTAISRKAPKNLIFKLMLKVKAEIKKNINKDYIFHTSIKPIAHNQRILSWFKANVGTIFLAENNYYGIAKD